MAMPKLYPLGPFFVVKKNVISMNDDKKNVKKMLCHFLKNMKDVKFIKYNVMKIE